MQEEILKALVARKGHFRFESGYHGDLWLEIPLLYRHPKRLRRFAAELVRRLKVHEIDAVCGPLVEGAFLAQMVAEQLGVEFYFAEQFTHPHGNALYPIGYRIPKALRTSLAGKRVAIVDDVINAGSAVSGTFADLQDCGATTVALGALLALGGKASEFAAQSGVQLESLGYLANTLWEPRNCPLCASGADFE